MNRLYQKSVIASSGVHVLLALILVVCPAFLVPKPKVSDVQPVTFIPDILIDQVFDNPGGSPGRLPPAPTPAPPAVRPEPPREKPKETSEEPTPTKTDSDSVEVTKETTKKKQQFSLTPVTRKKTAKPTTKDSSTTEAEDRQWREERQRLLSQIGRSANNIRSGTGSATAIEEGYGTGSGPSYASYAAWVLTVFDNAWVAPEDASSEDATAEVSVTIARDGSIISKRIVKRSGDSAVDASVQRALDKVTTMGRPFPEGAKDKQRSYIIPFNMKTKRGTA
jgi:TonB family protein